ncbi:MAG: hypothetical protein WKF47_02750 [Geodermatophilaceae bacterium]
MWPAALAAPASCSVHWRDAQELRQQTVRLWNTPEAALAATLRRPRAGDSTGWRSPPCLARRRAGGRHRVTDRRAQAGVRAMLVAALRTAYPGHAVLRRRADRRRDRRGSAGRAGRSPSPPPSPCTAGLLAGPAHRASRLLGLRPGRAGRVLQRRQAQPRRSARPI